MVTVTGLLGRESSSRLPATVEFSSPLLYHGVWNRHYPLVWPPCLCVKPLRQRYDGRFCLQSQKPPMLNVYMYSLIETPH